MSITKYNMKKIVACALVLIVASCIGCTSLMYSQKEMAAENYSEVESIKEIRSYGQRRFSYPSAPHNEDQGLSESPAPEKLEQVNKEPLISSSSVQSPFVNHITIIDQLSWSSFGYTVPKTANIEDDIEVTMLMNPSVSVEKIKDMLPEGDKTTTKIQISRTVKATLTSKDFAITPITSEKQAIISDDTTTWKWSLVPYGAGPNKIVKITVSAIIFVDGEKTERYLDTYQETINIKVTPIQRVSTWLSEYWQWAWSALLIPIGGLIYANIKKRKSN